MCYEVTFTKRNMMMCKFEPSKLKFEILIELVCIVRVISRLNFRIFTDIELQYVHLRKHRFRIFLLIFTDLYGDP